MAGLTLPADPASAMPTSSARVYNLGGVLPVGNVAAALAMDRPSESAEVERQQGSTLVQNLAAHIDSAWTDAKEAKQTVEQRMIEAIYSRRGEYTPEKLAQIQVDRQPPIFMMVASSKMRQIEALMRDTLIGTGSEKPWTLNPSPVPELPPEIGGQMLNQLTMEIQQALMSGFAPSVEAARMRMRQLMDEVQPLLMEEARRRCERMEKKMEDQQVEGGFLTALDQFITDLATFPAAFLYVAVRNKPKLTWGANNELSVETKPRLEFERISPLDVYPSRYARTLQDGPLIIRRRLSLTNLNEMIGVEGYNDAAIRAVIDRFGDTGLREWLSIDSQQAAAEGRLTATMTEHGMIDALQFFGTASGKLLLEWGMDKGQVPEPTKDYNIEAWRIGPYVIKAVLNADPLARRPLYGTSYQKIPGSVWGNAPHDLLKDCEAMCNAAARALAANMAISSGPQVGIISNRLPAGEDVTEIVPWKIWQFETDPMGSTARPIEFFQPTSNANELMTVYERFSQLADEYTGIPRYMAGFNEGAGGAGRTASGISMMIGNASKIIKQVLGNVDTDVLRCMLEYQYYYNMRYGEDPELKGDVSIIARGAMSITTKEAAQVRMNEFLQIALTNPMVQQIVGMEGVAELLRPTVKRLDINPDKVVPSLPVLRQRAAQAAAAQMMMAQQGGQPGQPGQQQPPKPGGERLQDGSPTTDQFSPAQ